MYSRQKLRLVCIVYPDTTGYLNLRKRKDKEIEKLTENPNKYVQGLSKKTVLDHLKISFNVVLAELFKEIAISVVPSLPYVFIAMFSIWFVHMVITLLSVKK